MAGRGTIWAGIALALIAAGGIAWWALYPRPSDEDRVRALVGQLERGIEAKDPQRVIALISEEYDDKFGLRRKDLVILVLRVLRAEGDYEVMVHQMGVEISGRQATVTLEGEVTLSQGTQVVGRYLGTAVLSLRREGREWRLVSSSGWQKRVLRGAWGGL